MNRSEAWAVRRAVELLRYRDNQEDGRTALSWRRREEQGNGWEGGAWRASNSSETGERGERKAVRRLGQEEEQWSSSETMATRILRE